MLEKQCYYDDHMWPRLFQTEGQAIQLHIQSMILTAIVSSQQKQQQPEDVAVTVPQQLSIGKQQGLLPKDAHVMCNRWRCRGALATTDSSTHTVNFGRAIRIVP